MGEDTEFLRLQHDLDRATKLAERMMDERDKANTDLKQLQAEHKMSQMSYNSLCAKLHNLLGSTKTVYKTTE